MRPWRIYFYCCAAGLTALLSTLTAYHSIERRNIVERALPIQAIKQAQAIVAENAESSLKQAQTIAENAQTSLKEAQDIAEKAQSSLRENTRTLMKPLRGSGEKPVPSPPPPPTQIAKIYPSVIAPWTKLIKTPEGKEQPRSFVFSEIERLDEWGLPVTEYDQKERKHVLWQMGKRLCSRSKKFASSKYDANMCQHRVELLKCSSCSELDGSWYSASSVTGAVFSKVDAQGNLLYPYYNDGPFMYQNLDIAVPIAGQDDKLKSFALHLGSSMKKFREGMAGSRVSVRLLITRFPFDAYQDPAELEAFRHELTALAALDRPGDSVTFIPVEYHSFNRAKAINALHRTTSHRDDSVIAVMDVDMNISSLFLRNALIFAFPGASAYFPIFWSEYNPETTALVDKFMPHAAEWKYTDHHGYWRKSSYGMYVLAGPDANRIWMNEKFIGWGGEDNDFFKRVGKHLNIIRHQERGLTHVWHGKECKLGKFVKGNFYKACVGALAHTEGSQLGMYLRAMKMQHPDRFKQVMHMKSPNNDEPEEIVVQDVKVGEEEDDIDSTTVLVAVISSRESFNTRVRSIMSTWGKPEDIPDRVTLRFFVGAAEENSGVESGSEEDIANLANGAGIMDMSSIVVLTDVADNEYPPVRKNTAMIRHLEEVVTEFENDANNPRSFQWIYKVDDDAYVHFDGLLQFLKKRNPSGYKVYGERGYGRPEDEKGLRAGGMKGAYCTGGPGYILSRPTLKQSAPGMAQCVEDADKSEQRSYLWHSDTVIGLCIYQHTKAICWNDDDYQKNRIFRNNHKNQQPFLHDSELPKIVAMHPYKDAASMQKTHERFLKFKYVKAIAEQ